MSNDIEHLKTNQEKTDERLSKMEARQDKFVETIDQLQQTVDEMRIVRFEEKLLVGKKLKMLQISSI